MFNSPYFTFHIQCPFIFYSRERSVLTYIRSYFIKDIVNINKIKEDSYNSMLVDLENIYEMKEEELNLYKSKIKKIYKKSLQKNDDCPTL